RLGDGWRGVVGQHDAAGTERDGVGVGGHVCDEHRGRRGCDRGHVVVLGVPDPRVAGFLRLLCQGHRTGQRIGDGLASGDGGKVEDREWERHRAPFLRTNRRRTAPTATRDNTWGGGFHFVATCPVRQVVPGPQPATPCRAATGRAMILLLRSSQGAELDRRSKIIATRSNPGTPMVTDPARARQLPELAVLSAYSHGDTEPRTLWAVVE